LVSGPPKSFIYVYAAAVRLVKARAVPMTRLGNHTNGVHLFCVKTESLRFDEATIADDHVQQFDAAIFASDSIGLSRNERAAVSTFKSHCTS
jgi:hypothetical protein